jgi:hypothetical protein
MHLISKFKKTIEIEVINRDILPTVNIYLRQSRCPRGVRHELSSLAGTLGSWDRIPLKGMDVCVRVYSVFVLPCVFVAALRRADHSSAESYRLCKKDYETEEDARAQQRTVETLMNE